MKLLVLASTLDLKYRLGCTPSWWQFLKAFQEGGNEVIAIPYLGDPVETPWWRTYENPCSWESKLVYRATDPESRRFNGNSGWSARMARFLIDIRIRPKWKKHLFSVLSREKDIDAIFLLNIPVNQFTGIPTALREEFGVKVVYYEGDMPTILPKYAIARGFRFSYYDGADLSEYDLFFSNSKGVIPDLQAMGAKRVYPLYWAADPELFSPVEVERDYDVSFYGHGVQLREEWMRELIAKPSEALPNARFVVGGGGFVVHLGRAVLVGGVPYAQFPRFVNRSKINLNITRTSHTTIHASATSRPFELAACGACIVSQPYAGIEEWFEVGKEILVARSAGEAVEQYSWLLGDGETASEFGRRARARLLRDHTFSQRVRQVTDALRALT